MILALIVITLQSRGRRRSNQSSPVFSASLLTLHVLLTSRPPLITDTHCQARGGAAHRFGGPGLMLGKPHHRKAGGSRYAPSFDRLGIGVSFFGFDIRR